MKKCVLSFFIALLIVLTGCNMSQPMGDTATVEPTEKDLPSTPQVTVTPKPTNTPGPEPGNLEAQNIVYYAWKNSIDTVWVYAACELVNTGGAPIEIGFIDFAVLGENNEVYGTITMNLAVPEAIAGGETAYTCGSTIIDTLDDPELVKRIEVSGSFDPADKAADQLTFEGLTYYPPKGYSSHKVTGWVINTAEKTADDIRIACALYDSADNLLGVVTHSLSSTLGKGQKAAFEAGYPEFESKEPLDVAKIVGVAYNWSWD